MTNPEIMRELERIITALYRVPPVGIEILLRSLMQRLEQETILPTDVSGTVITGGGE